MIRIFFFTVFFTLLTVTGCKPGKPANKETPVAAAPAGLEIGNKAPDLEFQSPDGKTISLSSLHGKLVLVDFWASWCLPCRMENPNVVKVYNQYKDKNFTQGKGFTIYSVSLDTKKKNWIEAIENDGLSWENHVSDLSGWNSGSVAIYQISSIPSNFLLNGDGVIIDKDLRADALESKIKSLVQ